jgi:hypothetical protein
MRLETRSLGSCLFKDKILLVISQDRSVAGVLAPHPAESSRSVAFDLAFKERYLSDTKAMHLNDMVQRDQAVGFNHPPNKVSRLIDFLNYNALFMVNSTKASGQPRETDSSRIVFGLGLF